jgi:hypothetical protein
LVTVEVTVPSAFVTIMVVVEELPEVPPAPPAAPGFAAAARPAAPAQWDGDNVAALGETLVMRCSFLRFQRLEGCQEGHRNPHAAANRLKDTRSLADTRQIVPCRAGTSAKRAEFAVCVPPIGGSDDPR